MNEINLYKIKLCESLFFFLISPITAWINCTVVIVLHMLITVTKMWAIRWTTIPGGVFSRRLLIKQSKPDSIQNAEVHHIRQPSLFSRESPSLEGSLLISPFLPILPITSYLIKIGREWWYFGVYQWLTSSQKAIISRLYEWYLR